MPPRREVPETVEESRKRFESFLSPQENGCILWTGHKTGYGHGRFWFNVRNVMAHRHAWFLAGNTIPDGLILCHICKGTPSCCNVEHLRADTYSVNNGSDRMRDGTALVGEKHPRSVLTKEQVLEIRRRSAKGELGCDLAEEFETNKYVISDLLRRKTWKHI